MVGRTRRHRRGPPFKQQLRCRPLVSKVYLILGSACRSRTIGSRRSGTSVVFYGCAQGTSRPDSTSPWRFSNSNAHKRLSTATMAA